MTAFLSFHLEQGNCRAWLHSGEQFPICLLYHCKGQAENALFLSLLLLPSVSPPDVLGHSPGQVLAALPARCQLQQQQGQGRTLSCSPLNSGPLLLLQPGVGLPWAMLLSGVCLAASPLHQCRFKLNPPAILLWPLLQAIL